MHHRHWCIEERFSLLYCASLLVTRQTNVTERRLSAVGAQQDSYREVGQYVKRVDRFSIVGLSRTCESRVSNTCLECMCHFKSSPALLLPTIRLAFVVSPISVPRSVRSALILYTEFGTFGNYRETAWSTHRRS